MNIFFNQIQISKLFNADYILDTTPKSSGLYQYIVIVFGLLLLMALFLWFFFRKSQKLTKEFVKKIITLFITTAILGLIFIFFRIQEISYLSSRLMLLVLIIMFVVWSGFILYFRLVTMPGKIKIIKEQENFNRYLPKKKGNKK